MAADAVGRHGVRLADIGRELLPRIEGTTPSAVFLAAGVKDVLRLTRPAVWGDELAALMGFFCAIDSEIVVTGTPLFEQLPVLESPLREFLARRGHALDRVSAEVCLAQGAIFVPFGGLVLDEEFFAADRFHPSASGYAPWANLLAEKAAGMP